MMTVGQSKHRTRAAIAFMALTIGCSRVSDPTTPEEKAARGDELLRNMSDTLKGSQSFRSPSPSRTSVCDGTERSNPTP